MLSHAYFLAKFRFDTAENEPAKKLKILAEFLQKFANSANFAHRGALFQGHRRRGLDSSGIRSHMQFTSRLTA